MTTIRSDLQKQAQSHLLQYAIFRWENAVILAVTILLSFFLRRPFPGWPFFGWPLLGLLGVGVLIYTSLNDSETNSKVLIQLYQEQFDPRAIKSKNLRQDIEKALEYEQRIEEKVQEHREGIMRDRLEDTANRITDWLNNIYQLALRLDAYQRDTLLVRERDILPSEIEKLHAQLQREQNFDVRQQLEEVIDSKGKHFRTLSALNDRMKQADLQIEQSLTALATIYSQVQLINAQSMGSGRADRIQEDIQEQVERLNDLVSSINDVYDYNRQGLG